MSSPKKPVYKQLGAENHERQCNVKIRRIGDELGWLVGVEVNELDYAHYNAGYKAEEEHERA